MDRSTLDIPKNNILMNKINYFVKKLLIKFLYGEKSWAAKLFKFLRGEKSWAAKLFHSSSLEHKLLNQCYFDIRVVWKESHHIYSGNYDDFNLCVKGCVRYIFASFFCMSKREHLWNKEKCFLFHFKISSRSWDNQILTF